ncbi:MAG: tape measure protein, partial [Sporomusa sp.]
MAVKAVDIATNALKSSLDGAISRYDTMNRFPRVMEQIGFSTDESNASIERLSEGIDGLPTSLDGIAASTQSIALLTGDLEMATETTLALNNAFLASGSSTADAERGLVQYSQMLSKGSVDMQSWRTLQETMGYALRETATELGITSGNTNDLYDALKSGSVSFDQFNSALIECSTRTGGFAEVAKTASAG